MRASFLDNPKVDHMTGGHPDGGQVDLKTLKDHKNKKLLHEPYSRNIYTFMRICRA